MDWIGLLKNHCLFKKGTREMIDPMTLAEIAKTEGISHQAIAEILQRALKKFHKALEDRGYKLEDLI